MAFVFFSPDLKTTPSLEYAKYFDPACRKSACKLILKECDATRKTLLLLLSKKASSSEELEEALKGYVGAVKGLVYDLEGKPAKLCKSRFAIRWQNTVGPEFLDSGDVGFDLYNMLVNFCLWHLRAAALNTINDPLVQLNETTLLFRKLRIVAGVWEAIAQNGVGAKDGDLAANVVRAYSLLALAQAEEVTLQMGLAKRSPADYLSKVAHDLSVKYGEAAQAVAAAKQARCHKMYYYLMTKSDIHMAYAYALRGASLLDKGEGGQAVRCQQSAGQYLERSYKYGAEYLSGDRYFKDNAVYAKVKRVMQLYESKYKNDNALVYRKPVPAEPVQLEAAQAAVQAEQWTLPPHNSQWTKEIYDAFDVSKLK